MKAILLQCYDIGGIYDSAIARFYDRHHRWAKSTGIHYVAAGVPKAAESSWLRVELALHFLEAGYDAIMYVDADAVVADMTTDISILKMPGIGMTRHPHAIYGEHWNAGVFYLNKSHPGLMPFMREWFKSKGSPIDRAPWAEQWAFNELMRDNSDQLCHVIPNEWNDTLGVTPCLFPKVLAAHGFGPHAERGAVLEAELKKRKIL